MIYSPDVLDSFIGIHFHTSLAQRLSNIAIIIVLEILFGLNRI
nr:hypothetical protein [Scytonema sp. UIC 10036]